MGCQCRFTGPVAQQLAPTFAKCPRSQTSHLLLPPINSQSLPICPLRKSTKGQGSRRVWPHRKLG
jgi:hypothetical protein